MVSLNTTIGGLYAFTSLEQSNSALQTSVTQLSSGLRINSSEDDAAGVSVRDRFRTHMMGIEKAMQNIQTASNCIQVGEAGLDDVTNALQQMRSLAVRAADANLSPSDRQNIQLQITGLLNEIDHTASTTTFNGQHLLDGSIADREMDRRGASQIQTNETLTDGLNMIGGTSVTGNSATTPNAVSQGTYEVKLVFDPAVTGQVDAQIYFSGDGSDTVPISTVTDVSDGAKDFAAGGISFTVGTASTLDVGLTSYVKAYAFITGNTDDHSLVIQTAPDEGLATRVGIQSMSVASLFRVNAPGGNFDVSSIRVDTQVEAQDLIGQIDDALSFVGQENARLGEQNKALARLTNLRQQDSTNDSNGMSQINDADMARVATQQARNSILVQSGDAMIAQANTTAQLVLQLLR